MRVSVTTIEFDVVASTYVEALGKAVKVGQSAFENTPHYVVVRRGVPNTYQNSVGVTEILDWTWECVGVST